jgi:hypothetical protein
VSCSGMDAAAQLTLDASLRSRSTGAGWLPSRAPPSAP